MSEWTHGEVEILVSLYNNGATYDVIANELSRTRSSIDRKIRLLKKAGNIFGDRYKKQYAQKYAATKGELLEVAEVTADRRSPVQQKLPPGYTANVDTDADLVVELNEFLVAGDFHVPGESPEWINTLIKYGNEHDVHDLFIAGDFWNHDSVSRWQLKDPELNLKVEIKSGIALVKKLLKHFRLYFVCGNHDARLPKALNYSLNFSDWMEALFGDSVTTTNFDYCKVISAGETFRVCHPEYYSVNKGSQVALLSHDLQEHIIMGHQHFASLSTNKTGRYICADLGCMCDANKFYYKKSATTRYPRWENGFVHVKDGKLRMICDYSF